MTPIVKWAGGKSRLLEQLHPLLPKMDNIEYYIEPFMGGGAMYFHLHNPESNIKYLLNDLNPNLINLYKQVQENFENLVAATVSLEKEYFAIDESERSKFYYRIRDEYNEVKEVKLTPLYKAVYFIFLNKQGYNGLYRVNSKGKFNAPIGKYRNRKFLALEKLTLANHKFNSNTGLFCMDYTDFLAEQCHEFVSDWSKVFVYLDPPYRRIKSNSFTAYCESNFSNENEFYDKLEKTVEYLDMLGASVMLSNAFTEDNYFQDRYKQYDVQEVLANRSISCKGKNRGLQPEVVIRNYL